MRVPPFKLSLVIALFAGATAIAALSAGHSDGGRRASAAAPAQQGHGHLRVHGKVHGLYPGSLKWMRVRVRNTSHHPLRLRWIKARARDAGPDCTRENLKLRRQRRPSVRLAAHSRRRVTVPVRMVPMAPDACQGAIWPLRFKVKARRHR